MLAAVDSSRQALLSSAPDWCDKTDHTASADTTPCPKKTKTGTKEREGGKRIHCFANHLNRIWMRENSIKSILNAENEKY